MHCKGQKALFSIVQYIEEERRAEQLLRDGVWEMMDERCFQAWMLKTKNGSIEAAAASQKFQDLVADPASISDMLGSCPRYAQRVAVKKKDVITFRDLTEHAQITRAAEAEKQKRQHKPTSMHLWPSWITERSSEGRPCGIVSTSPSG